MTSRHQQAPGGDDDLPDVERLEIVPSSEKDAEDSDNCTVHKQELLTLFCFPCEQCLCVSCSSMEPHLGHMDQVVVLAKAFPCYKKKMVEACETIKNRQEKVAKELARQLNTFSDCEENIEAPLLMLRNMQAGQREDQMLLDLIFKYETEFEEELAYVKNLLQKRQEMVGKFNRHKEVIVREAKRSDDLTSVPEQAHFLMAIIKHVKVLERSDDLLKEILLILYDNFSKKTPAAINSDLFLKITSFSGELARHLLNSGTGEGLDLDLDTCNIC